MHCFIGLAKIPERKGSISPSSSPFSSWCSRTKQEGWMDIRFYLFVSGVNQVE